MDGRRPVRSEHPAPAAIDAWRARYATQPWKTRHGQAASRGQAPARGQAPSASSGYAHDPRWQEPRAQTWQGYRPSSEVLSNTSEQWFPPDAFGDSPDETPRQRSVDAAQARHRATRRPVPSRRGAGRWARQLVVLLPLALASSSWATLGDAEAPEGGWFPENYRMALGAESGDTTTTVEDSTALIENPVDQQADRPVPRRQAELPLRPARTLVAGRGWCG